MLNAAKWIAGDDLVTFKGDLDRGFTFGESRWRASIWQQRGSIAITLRLVPVNIPKLEDLGLPSSVVNLANTTQGLILFCGPTGSGKSTSMAALVDRINRTKRQHIITIEDPIEYVHPSHQSIVHQREVGSDTKDFATGLRSALRQDPDVILVGELRDPETMKTALNAAETGHLVLATVHASSAAGAVSRIVNSFAAEEQPQIRLQLSTTLQASIIQLLLPDKQKINKRVLATEVLLGTNAVKAMIRDNRLHEIVTVLDTQAQAGMISMEKSLALLAANNYVDYEYAKSFANDEVNFEEHYNKYSKSGNSLDPIDNLSMGDF
jgi:twitching motility protein PilT